MRRRRECAVSLPLAGSGGESVISSLTTTRLIAEADAENPVALLGVRDA